MGKRGKHSIVSYMAKHRNKDPRLYQLPPEKREQLKLLADKNCPKCKGSGIANWEKKGEVAVVCECAEKTAREAEAKVQEVGDKIAAELEAQKKKWASYADPNCEVCKGTAWTEGENGRKLCECARPNVEAARNAAKAILDAEKQAEAQATIASMPVRLHSDKDTTFTVDPEKAPALAELLKRGLPEGYDPPKGVIKKADLDALAAKDDVVKAIVEDRQEQVNDAYERICKPMVVVPPAPDARVTMVQTVVKRRCTCDDPGEGACPEHGEENARQDEEIRKRNEEAGREQHVAAEGGPQGVPAQEGGAGEDHGQR